MSIATTLRRTLGLEPRPYECVTCHARFRRRYYVCPDCGGFSIERAVWIDED